MCFNKPFFMSTCKEEDASLLAFDEILNDSLFLSVSDVFFLMENKIEENKTKKYVSLFSSITKQEFVQDLRKTLSAFGLHGFEVAQLINLMPESVEEAKCIIPSLYKKDDVIIQQAIDEVVFSKEQENVF